MTGQSYGGYKRNVFYTSVLMIDWPKLDFCQSWNETRWLGSHDIFLSRQVKYDHRRADFYVFCKDRIRKAYGLNQSSRKTFSHHIFRLTRQFRNEFKKTHIRDSVCRITREPTSRFRSIICMNRKGLSIGWSIYRSIIYLSWYLEKSPPSICTHNIEFLVDTLCMHATHKHHVYSSRNVLWEVGE